MRESVRVVKVSGWMETHGHYGNGNGIYLFIYLYVNFRKDIDSEEPHVLCTGEITFLYIFKLAFSSSFNILFILITAEFMYLSVLAFFT